MKPRPRRPAALPRFTADHGDDLTEVLPELRTGEHDGRTVPWHEPGAAYFTGASPAGLPEPVAVKETGRDTEPLAFRRAQEPPPAPARPAPDVAIFGRSPLGWALICGVCLKARHASAAANMAEHSFSALRASAAYIGWRLDAFGQWACPACQDSPAYWAPGGFRHSAPRVRRARQAGRPVGAYAEFCLSVQAEQATFERVRASRARTATLIRPDGRFVTARILAGAGDGYQPRHAAAAAS